MKSQRIPWPGWRYVRARIWEKAEELHAADFYKNHEENITRPERYELRESGYFYRAKLIVLKEVNRELKTWKKEPKQRPPTREEWEAS
jgi:hypothetical protein